MENDLSTLPGAIDFLWKELVLAESRWSPDRNCYDLADEYSKNGLSEG